MRILLVHNYYGSAAPSGENREFEAERRMLERHGETVETFTRHSDEIRGKGVAGLVKGAFCTVGNPFAAHALADKIRAFRPDVVHFHNQFPLISPLAIRAAHRCGVKVVMTLHNYRTVCAAGVPARCGKVCTECFLRGVGTQSISSLNAETQRRRAKAKVEEWLEGVDGVAFGAALEKLVEVKSAEGEYRFKKPEERVLAFAGAQRFFAEFSRKIVVLSDGRCVYFAPDERARKRNANNAISWAEYAFHAVSNGGAKLAGRDCHERWYDPRKIPAFASIVTALTVEHCFVRLSGTVSQDAIVFAGVGCGGESVQVVTRLDETGNMDANLSEVTFTSTNRGQKKLPRLMPLTEAVRTVVHHQTTAGSYSPDARIVANPMEMCKGGGPARQTILPAIRHRCYRGMLGATLPLAINIWLYRKWWARWVDCFVVLSEFQKRIMVECGFPAGKIAVKGNFVISGTQSLSPTRSQRSGVVFVGRLSDEKGVKTLLSAWRILTDGSPELRDGQALLLIGDGERRSEYEKLANGLNVQCLGLRSHDEVLDIMAGARVTVLPSECWETFGLTVVESMQVGTPVVVSDMGALPDLVNDAYGAVFQAGDPKALADAIGKVLKRSDDAETRASCMRWAQERYAEDVNYRQLMDIYGICAAEN